MKRIELTAMTYDEMRMVRGGLADGTKPPPKPKTEIPEDLFQPEPGDIWVPILL